MSYCGTRSEDRNVYSNGSVSVVPVQFLRLITNSSSLVHQVEHVD